MPRLRVKFTKETFFIKTPQRKLDNLDLKRPSEPV
jgi:hypothetical protein